MSIHTVESIPDEILAIARKKVFEIDVNDLDKRVRALPDIFSMPKTNLCYAKTLAAKLRTKCLSAGRGDLVAEIDRIVSDTSYETKRKAIEAKNDELKQRYERCYKDA